MRIIRAFIFLLACSVTASASTEFVYQYEDEPAETSSIPALRNLAAVAKTAQSINVPILVEFSTPWCEYCEALEKQVLKPLLLSREYSGRIIVKKLEVNTYSSITGFDGRQYSSDQISRMYGVDLYPTLVFFNAGGQEISKRIVGITVLEYVAAELEKAIDDALRAHLSRPSDSTAQAF